MFAVSTVVATLASATLADMITPDGRTATQVIQSGDVYDVYTNTVRGNTGFNSFSTFDVYAETTANLHLADGTGKLINVVRDSSSHIDGVLNSYKDGRIGGDVYFLNPHGIIVGKSGIINAGSVSMSTPTAAFVEQLIARDGSISATATQAVLAGDMPINEKGTISIKGKVNAARSVELRAGNVEVKEGKVSTDVKFGEMVNTGDRKVDTKGMSIRDGKLSFSGSPAQEGKAAEAEVEPEVEAAEEPEVEAADGLASISIFADNVQVDGSALNAASVYIDPDVADITGAISGDYTVEARVITAHDIWVEAGKKLTSFTVNGNNEREAGDVSITITNLNITADTVNITASATTNTDGAFISIASSSITSTQAEDCGMCIFASSTNGNAGVDIQAGATLTSPGGMIVAAATGAVVASGGLDNPDQVEFKPAEGGGNASVTVGGKLQAKSALTVTAAAMGTKGDASVDITPGGELDSTGYETKKVGELAFERKPEYVVNENDTEEWVNYKNAAYMYEYDQYLRTLESATVAAGTIDIAASSAAGNASVTQESTSSKPSIQSSLTSNKSATITAEAARDANVQLNGKISSGDISATAKGATSTLSVLGQADLKSKSHMGLVQEGTKVSVEKSNGMIALEAGVRGGDQAAPDGDPGKKEGVLLEVMGKLDVSRDKISTEDPGSISLVSAGKLTVTSAATVFAYADNGTGGTIYLDAPEYDIVYRKGKRNNPMFDVQGKGSNPDYLGTVFLMNHNVLEGTDINQADTISSNFIKDTLGLTATNGSNDAPKEWTSGFTLVKLSGDIKLTKDVEASIRNSAIADGTHIYGEGHSLTLTNSGWHLLSPVSMVTIGKDVTIEGVKDFTFNFRKKSLVQTLTGYYVFSPTSLTVGDNFKVQAGGDVTIAMEGSGNTYIEFGRGLDIQAGGNVAITATTTNGWGGALGNTSSTDVLASIVKMIPGANDTAVGNALSKLGVFQFKTGDFFMKTFKRIFNIEDKPNPKSLPQIGARVSMASVTFANENAGSIRGNSVTIGSASTADVSGLQMADNGGSLPFALSVGFIYDRSLVDLGKGLQITATGFKEVGKGENKRDVSVSITSTTNSKISLGSNFTNNHPDYAIGLLLAVGIDNNTVKIDKSVNITAERSIDILTRSDIENDSFLSLGCGMDKKAQPSNPEPGTRYQTTGVAANNLIMFGLDLLKHESNTTISGTLVSNNGDINMESVDNISSSLSMAGSIQYTASLAEAIKDPERQGFGQFLWSTFKNCFLFDLAISKHKLGDVIDKFSSADNLGQDLDAGDALLQGLVGSEPTKDHSIAVSIATDIVITQNKLLFNGEAHADNGSITLNAETSIEAACGAETSIVGVPSKLAVSGSISVPVLVGDTTVEVGPGAILSAGDDISVSSSTDLPMSFDFMGWNAWAKFAKSTGASKAGDFISALRGSLKYIQTYGDNGEFGVLGAMTSSHASTLMKGTGALDENDTITVGGDLVVDVRNLNTKTIIDDGASLTAGGKLSATSSSSGTQVTFAGQLPVFLTVGSPTYLSTTNAASGFGGSVIVGEKTLNTVTYIGAAKLKAGQLDVESTGDAFMMEMSLAGTFGTGKNGVQGGVNVIIENKTTVSEICGGAEITITGNEASSVTATDGSTLLNISGMEADGGQTAVGAGVAVTLNKALTAAMVGNNNAINSSYKGTWNSLSKGYNMPFAREGEITLTFDDSYGDLNVLAENTGTLVNVGISGAVQTTSDEGVSPIAAVAANVGVLYSETEATARQYAVNATGYKGVNDVSTEAFDYTTIVSVAGDASINLAGKNVVTGAGALSVNRADMDAVADVRECNYRDFRKFIVYSANVASAVAVDVAASIGSATANIAAGSSWNSLTGNTSSYLGGGLVKATYVAVDSFTDLTALSVTLGAAVNFSHGASVPNLPDVPDGDPAPRPDRPNGVPGKPDDDPHKPEDQGPAPLPDTPKEKPDPGNQGPAPLPYTPGDDSGNQPAAPLPTPGGNSAGNWKPAPTAGDSSGQSAAPPALSDNLLFDKGDTSYGKYVGDTLGRSLNNNKSKPLEDRLENNDVDAPPPAGNGTLLTKSLKAPALLGASGGSSFAVGASIARNAVEMHSSAIIEGCKIDAAGILEVAAKDVSVITAVSVAAAADLSGVGAGGVFSFAPVSSTTEAAIRQKDGVNEKLDIKANHLMLFATDDHRERLWSFGGGCGQIAGCAMVLSWGSFDGASTKALIQNVDAAIGSSANIQSTSTLDATFISVGASGGGKVSASGMVNYINFNNQVQTEIEGSTLTIAAENGRFTAKSKGTRQFTDGVGALSIGLSSSASVGGALSLIYVGGNGSDDTNLTQTKVTGSFINNSGSTELLAESSTTGILAGANAAVTASGGGATIVGGFSWVSDASITKVEITDTYFNQRDEEKESDRNANFKADATSGTTLTLGFGSLAVQIGAGAAVGATIAVLKDNATTEATMTGGGVGSAHDFTLHASGNADLSGLIIGGAASGNVAVCGSAFAATINHIVNSKLDDAVMNMSGALTIKAENTSNVGKGDDTRFTVANAAVGVGTAGIGIGVNYISVTDKVTANANNVSVNAGSMSVTADEKSSADAVTVNLAGGMFGSGDVNVVLPVLDGAVEASVTSDKLKTRDGAAVGITTTAGGLTVAANNEQWLRSHLWAFVLSYNPSGASVSANICVNSINLAGTATAKVQGEMPLTLAGDLSVTADTNRYATYTTVPVSLSTGAAINVDVNILRVSNDTSVQTPEEGADKKNAVKAIDGEIAKASDFIESVDISPDGSDRRVSVGGGVRGSMSGVAALVDAPSVPSTSALVDLRGKSAEVEGSVTVKATDTIDTTPDTVSVTGGLLAIAPHINMTFLQGTVSAAINNSVVTAGGNITIDTAQKHSDNFDNVAVAVAAVGGTAGVYRWVDNAVSSISVGDGTQLKSTGGAVNIGTHSDISEDFTHVNTNIGLGNVALLLPDFQQDEKNTISIGNGVGIEAAGAVAIGTNSLCNFKASTYDITLAAVSIGVKVGAIGLATTQELTTGSNVTIKGRTVDILQKASRDINIIEDHISATALALSFPFLNITDTVTANLGIGNGNQITATAGALNIGSDVAARTNLSFLGVNAGGINLQVAANSFTENITNKVKLGDNVRLRGDEMEVGARSAHTANMKGNNIVANTVTLTDALKTRNDGNVVSDVSIGTGFDAKGKSLTLTALTTDEYLCNAEKVTVSLLIAPYSNNSFETKGTASATITLGGGRIDVEDFHANAMTDVTVKVRQLLAGGSITVNVNTGSAVNEITQTATVTLGTDGNELDILTDSIGVTAHNKYLFERLDPSAYTMVYGGNVGLVSGTSVGDIEATQKETATVTLGSNARVRRRGDAEHYLAREDYSALFSATNNVESNATIHLFAGGALNANCVLTTYDETTANATLNLLGSIDTWGNTELTAYSHVRHAMVNTVESGALIPTFTAKVKNFIDTDDKVNISGGGVESIGNITIQSGSTKGEYKLVDGATVLAGDDDTNATSFNCSAGSAQIHNNRQETVTIGGGAAVRAGGELIIYNDSSANTPKKVFNQSWTSADYLNAARDTAAEVTSVIDVRNSGGLYAGLGSAIKMAFQGKDANLAFTTAQRIFDGSTEQNGIWLAPAAEVRKLYGILPSAESPSCLTVSPLSLPGMAFRIVTKAPVDNLRDKLYSPSRHGLDIFVSADWGHDVATLGVTLQGHESGLIYNYTALDGYVNACATPDLICSEGVSIRSQAQGNLTLKGVYQFPYNTFVANSAHNLTITGEVCCGVSQFDAGGSFTLDTPDSDKALRGLLSMYTDLFAKWEKDLEKQVDEYTKGLVAASGNGGVSGLDNATAHYDFGKTYGTTFSDKAILDAVLAATQNTGEAFIRAMGTVTVNARIVDLNGHIYSGYMNGGDSIISIKPDFKVLNAAGEIIDRTAAQRICAQSGNVNRTFMLAGYTGLSLVYDALDNDITLSNYESQASGITIRGIIVNSNPVEGGAGLHAAGSTAPLTVDNTSGLKLNIGNINLQKMLSAGIRLENTGTGVTTTYTQDALGQWVKREEKNGIVTSTASAAGVSTYTDLADYQVKLEKTIETRIRETGRLTFSGSLNGAAAGSDCTVEGYVDGKETIVDTLVANHEPDGVTIVSPLQATYVKADGAHANGYAISVHQAPASKKLTSLVNPGALKRWQYQMDYVDRSTETLYVKANNDVAINLGAVNDGLTGLTVYSGTVNFIGVVTAPFCTVEAKDAITATADARVNCNTVTMSSAHSSIGTAEQALTFNASAAAFTADRDLYLATQKDIDSLKLVAGRLFEMTSGGNINGLDMRAGTSARVSAEGNITVTAGSVADVANQSHARVTLLSENGSIDVQRGADFTTAILTAEAEGDVTIDSAPERPLTLDYVESRNGRVYISANGSIFTIRSADMSDPVGKESTVFSLDITDGDLAQDYYALLQHYEELYFAKDEKGNYIHRAADGKTFILPDEDTARKELADDFKKLYENGNGDYLGGVMMSLSGTAAVEGTEFASEADALVYLAKDTAQDKLVKYANAYYDKLVADITAEILDIHITAPEGMDYGEFSEELYRLYWLRDCTGNYVNRDAAGNFISPLREGSTKDRLYSDDMCRAITARFAGRAPVNRGYKTENSAVLRDLAYNVSGTGAAAVESRRMAGGLASLIGGKPIGDLQTTVRAKESVTLLANNGHDIGGGTFHFTIKPIGRNADGTFKYSDWANEFGKLRWPSGVLVSKNLETGELHYTLAYIDLSTSPGNVELPQYAFLQRALPIDVERMDANSVRVYLRNYIGVDAPQLKAEGNTVLIGATGQQTLTLGDGNIKANNLVLSTTGKVVGSLLGTPAGSTSIYADGGIGDSGAYFRIGGASTFTLGSTGDVYVSPVGDVKIVSITGDNVYLDTNSGRLVLDDNAKHVNQPNIIGRRIDYYGDLDTGLNFRTTGTSRDKGGLHWHGGTSDTLKFNALNNAYAFWFVREGDAPNLDKVDIGYSGYICIVGLSRPVDPHPFKVGAKSGGALTLGATPAMGGGSDAITASFHQINTEASVNILEFEGAQAFDTLTLDGEGAYTVRAAEGVLLGSSDPVEVSGSATLDIASIGSTRGDAVNINSTGNLALASCEVMNDLTVNSTGNVSLEGVRIQGGEASIAGDTVSLNGTSGTERLVLSGSNGITGKDVSSSEIIANSSNAGVFLNSTATNSLSGSSGKSFVASVRPLDGSAGITVGDVSASGATSKVIIQAISDQLVLDGFITGAALEFYSTGVIDEEAGAMLLSAYPFWDVWQSEDPEVWNMTIETMESDLMEGYIWLVEEVESLAEKSCDSAQELRRKVNAEGQPHSAAPLRFTDKNGNTVSQEQFANLITSK